MTHPFRLLLPLSLAALMAASCAGSFVEEMEETEATGNVPVAFSATATDMKPDAASRAATIPGEITTNTITSMGVFAYYTGAGNFNNTSSEANFMNDQEISRTAASQPWKYSPTKYWPNTAGEMITFLAYSPHSSHFTEKDPDPIPIPEYYVFSGGTFTITGNPFYLEYAPRLQAEKQSDVLIDYKSNIGCTKKAGPITFGLEHLLAKIVFKVKSTEKIRIDRINISGMPTYGCFKYDEMESKYMWVEIGTEGDKDKFYSLPNKEVLASTLPTDAATPVSTFFMIPYEYHTLDCLLDIHYTDASSAKVEKTAVPFSYIPTKSGDVVAYTISIDKTTLEVTVDPWNTTIPPSNDKLGNIRAGDYYYTDGTVSPKLVTGKTPNGMVYYVDPTNPKKFKVMALGGSQQGLNWAVKSTYVIGASAQSLTDSKANAAAIKAAFDKKQADVTITETKFEEAFPAAGYCYNYTGKDGKDPEGTWYLPAKNDLQYLYCAYNGVAPANWNEGAGSTAITSNKAAWNKLLTAAGGELIKTSSGSNYWSGTEGIDGFGVTNAAWYIVLSSNGNTYKRAKNYTHYVRCVRDITYSP